MSEATKDCKNSFWESAKKQQVKQGNIKLKQKSKLTKAVYRTNTNCDQFGFRRNACTENVLLKVVTKKKRVLDNHRKLICIFLNLT